MKRLMKVIAVSLLSVAAFAQSNDTNNAPSSYQAVYTLGGTKSYLSLFTGKNTVAVSSIFQNAGKIGIGTTAPSSLLTVNGTIQSLTGGFTFPDNSVQTTAGLSSVTHDSTLSGAGSAALPLTISNPLTLAGTVEGGAPLVLSNESGGDVMDVTEASSPGFAGVNATTETGTALVGRGLNSYGIGVYAEETSGGGYALLTQGLSGYAWAGWFDGDVNVNGNLSKSGGSFKIDDPLDPANKYLYHSFVESPDMKDMYDGVVTTDESGEAMIQLPDWFQALNDGFRYQLTPIGEFAQAMVEREVENNEFVIKTDKPFVKVSWQVTGTRQDAWAKAHRIPVEVEKPEDERGYYLHPELFGEGPEKSVIAVHHPNLVRGAANSQR
jgi:hypothetical protein